jgi:hypothetical protein
MIVVVVVDVASAAWHRSVSVVLCRVHVRILAHCIWPKNEDTNESPLDIVVVVVFVGIVER